MDTTFGAFDFGVTLWFGETSNEKHFCFRGVSVQCTCPTSYCKLVNNNEGVNQNMEITQSLWKTHK